MKKSFRILAVVLAATMLMCCCSYAVDIFYHCKCRSSSSFAESYCDVSGYISAGFNGTVETGGGEVIDIGDYGYSDNDTAASAYDSYTTACTGSITSSHTINGHGFIDHDGF